MECVVPENIHTPPQREFHLGSPPPPWIFHICRELMTPHPTPPEFPQRKIKTPQPRWKSLFSPKEIIKSKERCRLWLRSGFHLILLRGLKLEHGKLLQSNLNDKILLIPLNERDRVVSVSLP